jgi:hypothetical protein
LGTIVESRVVLIDGRPSIAAIASGHALPAVANDRPA